MVPTLCRLSIGGPATILNNSKDVIHAGDTIAWTFYSESGTSAQGRAVHGAVRRIGIRVAGETRSQPNMLNSLPPFTYNMLTRRFCSRLPCVLRFPRREQGIATPLVANSSRNHRAVAMCAYPDVVSRAFFPSQIGRVSIRSTCRSCDGSQPPCNRTRSHTHSTPVCAGDQLRKAWTALRRAIATTPTRHRYPPTPTPCQRR